MLSYCNASPKFLHSKVWQPQGHSSFHLPASLSIYVCFPQPSSLILQDGDHRRPEVTCRHNNFQYKKNWVFLCVSFKQPLPEGPSIGQGWGREELQHSQNLTEVYLMEGPCIDHEQSSEDGPTRAGEVPRISNVRELLLLHVPKGQEELKFLPL